MRTLHDAFFCDYPHRLWITLLKTGVTRLPTSVRRAYGHTVEDARRLMIL